MAPGRKLAWLAAMALSCLQANAFAQSSLTQTANSTGPLPAGQNASAYPAPSQAATPAAKPAQFGTTYATTTAAPSFDANAYLMMSGSNAPRQQPIGSQSQANSNKLFQSPYDAGFFGGHMPSAEDLANVQLEDPKYDPGKSPDWVKDKLKMRYFQDNTEHHGNEDPYGFF